MFLIAVDILIAVVVVINSMTLTLKILQNFGNELISVFYGQ